MAQAVEQTGEAEQAGVWPPKFEGQRQQRGIAGCPVEGFVGQAVTRNLAGQRQQFPVVGDRYEAERRVAVPELATGHIGQHDTREGERQRC